jgi:hypothetical protein
VAGFSSDNVVAAGPAAELGRSAAEATKISSASSHLIGSSHVMSMSLRPNQEAILQCVLES